MLAGKTIGWASPQQVTDLIKTGSARTPVAPCCCSCSVILDGRSPCAGGVDGAMVVGQMSLSAARRASEAWPQVDAAMKQAGRV